MSTFNIINYMKNEKENIELSKNAINFLQKQFIRDGEKKTINNKFILQIVCASKKLQNWYYSSLKDQNNKDNGFYIKYKEVSDIPKEGDIIQITNIQIVKLPNRDSYLYFCDNVIKIKEIVQLMRRNDEKIYSIISSDSETFINMDNDCINLDYKYTTPNKNKYDYSLKENVTNNTNKKYTLLKDLLNNSNIKNPVFYLKCKSKSGIKDYVRKSEKDEGKKQFYYFLDTEGDLFQLCAFGALNTSYFNELIQFGCVYEISNLVFQRNTTEYSDIFPFHFWLSKFSSKIIKLEDKGDFTKIRHIYGKINTKISELNLEKTNIKINIVGIVLDNRGIFQTSNGEKNYRLLIIGDNSFHRICVKLWTTIINSERIFEKGDIIYFENVFYKEDYIYNELKLTKITKIYHCQTSPIEQELKLFYKGHSNIYEYKDLNVKYLNTKNNIPFKFISEFIKENVNKPEKDTNYSLVKIRGTLLNFIHTKNNIKRRCLLCSKPEENEYCELCGNKTNLSFKFSFEIKDCSGSLLTSLIGLKAELFLKMKPEEYIKIINDNNKKKIQEINDRILFKNYIFYGKYSQSQNGYNGGFNIIQFDEEKEVFYKNLIRILKK